MHVAGVSPLESWEWTWGEGIEVVNAYIIRRNKEATTRAVALYDAAAFLLSGFSAALAGEELQTFQEAFPGFGDVVQKAKEMTNEEMYAEVQRINRIFGGEEES